jgi:hypothetical protein
MVTGGAGRTKLSVEKTSAFGIGRKVESLMPRASQFFEIKRRLTPQSDFRASLTQAGFSEQEIETGLFVRTAQALARHWTANREGKSLESVNKAHQRFALQN